MPGAQPSSCHLGDVSGDEGSKIMGQNLLCWAGVGPSCWDVLSARVCNGGCILSWLCSSRQEKAHRQHLGLPSFNSYKGS